MLWYICGFGILIFPKVPVSFRTCDGTSSLVGLRWYRGKSDPLRVSWTMRGDERRLRLEIGRGWRLGLTMFMNTYIYRGR